MSWHKPKSLEFNFGLFHYALIHPFAEFIYCTVKPIQIQFQIEPKNLYLNKTTEKNGSIDFFGMKKNIHAQKLLIFQFNTHNVIPLKCNRINTRWMRRRPIHFTLYSNIRCYAEIPHIKITSFSSTIYIKKQRGLNGESWIKKNRVESLPSMYVFCVDCCMNMTSTLCEHFSPNNFPFFFFGKYFFSLALFTLNVANVLNFILKYHKKNCRVNFRTLCQ